MARFFGEFYLEQEFKDQFLFPSWLKGRSLVTGRYLHHCLVDAADLSAATTAVASGVLARVSRAPIDLKLFERPQGWRPAPCRYPKPRWYAGY